MKKILGLTIAAILVISMASVGTWAYFSDTEASTNNRLISGTLDLKTNNVDGVSQTLYATNMAPEDVAGPATIQLRNAGNTNGASLDIAFSYVESDGSPNPVNKSADETAAVMEVTTLTYEFTNLLNSISDSNVNGYKDVQDLKNANLDGQTGLNAGATSNFIITVQLRSDTGSDFKGDGITMTMTFTLNQ